MKGIDEFSGPSDGAPPTAGRSAARRTLAGKGERLDAMRSPRAGNSGFESQYVALFVRAERSALGVLGDRDAAEDVAAETMARAFARWPKISTYAPAWVIRVAANLAVDAIRRKPPREVARPQVQEGSVDRIVLRDELKKLSRRQREAIVLRYLLDLDEVEAARVMGIGVESLHTHVKRGMAHIRSDIGNFSSGADQP